MASFRELKVWQLGTELAIDVYGATRSFPNDERFGLISQMRRAAVSIPSNIAEGHGRNSTPEMIRFCGYALGSVAELETQITISQGLGFGNSNELTSVLEKCDTTSRMLHGLIRSNRGRDNHNSGSANE
ncbi:four helix bundle protein [Aeoliella mucimassa]|uniref:Four helix bundle protein n=1 Tax=Aeoliella mucimassa TaxID=2527972 RepID=A0A518AK12_9BACT|nr:four helix bundle protein [Aeoliella mucimassa]QDU55024.1 hypothetical protein Pan181_12090 [Aeoliella mucimassa]